MKKYYAILLSVLFICLCTNSWAIVGGTLETTSPAVGVIYGDATFGSAALIAPYWVLTAAHVVAGQSPADLVFIMGNDYNSPSANVYIIDEVIVHSQFDNTSEHNIALVHLTIPVNGITPLALNTSSAAITIGADVKVVGFGCTTSTSCTNTAKRSCTVEIDSFNAASFDSLFSATSCGACSGDSGGPAIVNISGTDTIIGIVVAGDENCNQYTEYLRVDAYRSFIDDTIINHPPTAPVLQSPADGSTIDGTSATFTWTESTDTDGDEIDYVLCVSQDPDFLSSMEIDIAKPATGIIPVSVCSLVLVAFLIRRRSKVSAVLLLALLFGFFLFACENPSDKPAEKTYTLDGLDPATPHYWKIVAEDEHGLEAESDAWSFTTGEK